MKKERRVTRRQNQISDTKNVETRNSGLRILGLILAIGITIFIVVILRRFYILNTYAIATAEYSKSENHYIKVTNYTGNSATTAKTYYKEGIIRTDLIPSQTRRMIGYQNDYTGEKIIRIDSEGNKVAFVSNKANLVIPGSKVIGAFGEGMTAWQNFLLSFMTKITQEECNGKDCYRIEIDGMKAWIDKETYLTVRMIDSISKDSNGNETNNVTDYIYQFGTVTSEQVAKPDLTGYKIQEQ